MTSVYQHCLGEGQQCKERSPDEPGNAYALQAAKEVFVPGTLIHSQPEKEAGNDVEAYGAELHCLYQGNLYLPSDSRFGVNTPDNQAVHRDDCEHRPEANVVNT